MHCDDVRSRLFDLLDRPEQDPAATASLEAHLESCDDCMALHDDIQAMQARARVWHELTPPAWNRQPGGPLGRPHTPTLTTLLQQWWPMAASSAALLLALGVYWQERPATAGDAPAALEELPAAGRLLAASRQERRQELEALTALLKAEMDRRSLETEQSLKYLISHQIRNERQLDAMRAQLQRTRANATEQL